MSLWGAALTGAGSATIAGQAANAQGINPGPVTANAGAYNAGIGMATGNGAMLPAAVQYGAVGPQSMVGMFGGNVTLGPLQQFNHTIGPGNATYKGASWPQGDGTYAVPVGTFSGQSAAWAAGSPNILADPAALSPQIVAGLYPGVQIVGGG